MSRHPEVVAKLVAGPELFPSGHQVVPLDSDLPEPDVHIWSPAEGTTWLTTGQVKSVPVGALGASEAPQGPLQVGQRDGATQKVGDPALGLEPPHARGVRRRRGLEVALTPRRDSHQGRGCSVTQVVVRAQYFDRIATVVHGRSHVAGHQGQPGTVDPDPAGEALEV